VGALALATMDNKKLGTMARGQSGSWEAVEPSTVCMARGWAGFAVRASPYLRALALRERMLLWSLLSELGMLWARSGRPIWCSFQRLGGDGGGEGVGEFVDLVEDHDVDRVR
jgi:hypothetical protein